MKNVPPFFFMQSFVLWFLFLDYEIHPGPAVTRSDLSGVAVCSSV